VKVAAGMKTQEDHERELFGCTTAAIEAALAGRSPRDLAIYAMGTLSNAQELIRCDKYEGQVEWSVSDNNANTLRQFINIAKYVMDKAVPR
jgi:flagellar motor component MotA